MTVRSLVAAWIAFSLTWVSLPPLAAGAASTCVAEDGRILFTDQACPPGTRPGKTGEGNLIQTRSRPRTRQAAHPRPPSSETDATPPSTTDSVLHAIPLVGRAILASRFARALADVSNLKIHSMAYMAEMGEWPTKPEQLGLDAATFHTADIVEIGYRRDGGIVAYLAPVFGPSKWLWMQPHDTLGGAQVAWQCRTNVEKGALLAGAIGGCERHDVPAAPSH